MEFETHCSRLVNVYGDKAYPPEKAALIWQKVKHLQVQKWSEVVDHLILNHRYAPQGKDILESMETKASGSFVEADSAIRERLIAESGECDWCGSHGHLIARREDEPGTPYAFRCKFCRAAEVLNISKQIPLWDDRRFSAYYPVKPGDVKSMFKEHIQ
jgi:hypothetical protein